jgi:hypothetical protein
MNSTKFPKLSFSAKALLSGIGKLLALIFVIQETDLVGYTAAGQQIPYSLLFTMYGFF